MSKSAVKPRLKTAIDAERGTIFRVYPNDVKIIGFDTPHRKGEHILWQSRALEAADENFARNIAENGFQSIIDVRKDGDTLEVVAGRRRTKAARRANEIRAERGLEPLKISVQVVRGDAIDLVGRVISENANRKDLSALELAEEVNDFMVILGASEERAAAACGRSVQSLKQLLRLLDLDSSVQSAVRDGKLSATAASNLAELPRAQQVAQLGELLGGGAGKPTVAKVRRRVRAQQAGQAVVQAPGKRLINKLLEDPDAVKVFGESGIAAIKYVFGDVAAEDIVGLTELIAKVG